MSKGAKGHFRRKREAPLILRGSTSMARQNRSDPFARSVCAVLLSRSVRPGGKSFTWVAPGMAPRLPAGPPACTSIQGIAGGPWPGLPSSAGISDLGSTVRLCPLASIAVGGDCYSLGYSLARAPVSW